jgi:hypothetical protein
MLIGFVLTSCASDPTGGLPRAVIREVPIGNPTEIHFELENIPASEYPKLSAEENSMSSYDRVRMSEWKYAQKIANERGWCPLGVLPPKNVVGHVGGGRRITFFKVECVQP